MITNNKAITTTNNNNADVETIEQPTIPSASNDEVNSEAWSVVSPNGEEQDALDYERFQIHIDSDDDNDDEE